MAYFNYRAKAKKLIKEGHLTHYEILSKYNKISPAMVLYFKNNKPMPIRKEKWSEYYELFKQLNLYKNKI